MESLSGILERVHMSRVVKARGTEAGKAAGYHKGSDGDVARLIRPLGCKKYSDHVRASSAVA